MKVLEKNSRKSRLWVIYGALCYVAALILTVIFSKHKGDSSVDENGANSIYSDYEKAVAEYSNRADINQHRIDSISKKLSSKEFERLRKDKERLESTILDEDKAHKLEVEGIVSETEVENANLKKCQDKKKKNDKGSENVQPTNTL